MGAVTNFGVTADELAAIRAASLRAAEGRELDCGRFFDNGEQKRPDVASPSAGVAPLAVRAAARKKIPQKPRW